MQSSKKKAGRKPANKPLKSSKKGKGEAKSGRSTVPLAYTRAMRTEVPQVSGSPYSNDGRVRIRHREYIKDVEGSVDFAVSALSINPGISSTFPWLSIMARQFESYLFHSVKFEYETQKSASTSGSLMLAVDFDAADAVPATKAQLMSYHNAVRSAVWAECCYSSDRKDLQKFGVQRYVRTGSLSPNLDIKTYDVGNVVVATQGEADTSIIGELYVQYDVELITPQASNPDPQAAFSLTRCTPSNANLFAGGTPDPLNGNFVSYSPNILTFSETGQFLISYYIGGDGVNPVGGGGVVSGGSTILSVQDGIGAEELGKFIQLSMIAGGTFTFDDTVDPGLESCLVITRLPSGFSAIVPS